MKLNTWLNQMKDRHSDRIILSKVTQSGYDSDDVELKCPHHGTFWSSPGKALDRDHPCPICYDVALRCRRVHKNPGVAALERYVEDQGLDLEIYSILSVDGNSIEFKCPDHGVVKSTLTYFKKNGCKKCVAYWRKKKRYEETKSMSTGEKRIYKTLTKYNVRFEKEKSFDQLPGYRFDFYLPDYNTIIEYHGDQHYKYTKVFHSTIEDFYRQQARDKIKEEFVIGLGMRFVELNKKTLKRGVLEDLFKL